MNRFKVRKKLSEKRQSTFDLLPNELLDLILTYYTKRFQGIIHFSTICKRCKEIADVSTFWLICDLNFYCPNAYYRALEPFPLDLSTDDITTAKKKVRYDRRDHETVELYLDWFSYTPRVYRIIVNSLTQRIEDRSMIPEIRKKFKEVFLGYHRLWHWNTPMLIWLRRWHPYFMKINDTATAISMILLPIFYLITVALMLGISQVEVLTFQHHFGFGFIYLFGGLYVIASFAFIPIILHDEIFNHAEYLDRPFNWFIVIVFGLIVVYVLAGLLTIGFLHYNLTESTSKALIRFFWMLPVPLNVACCFSVWISSILVMDMRGRSEPMPINFTLLGVCVTGMGLFVALQFNVFREWYASYFAIITGIIYPSAALFLILAFATGADNAKLRNESWLEYQQSAVYPYQLEVKLRSAYFLGSMSAITVFALLSIFVAEIPFNQLIVSLVCCCYTLLMLGFLQFWLK